MNYSKGKRAKYIWWFTCILLFVSYASVENSTEMFKAKQQALSLGKLLADTTPMFIQSYDSSSSSTYAKRGMSASQNAILYNGMPERSKNDKQKVNEFRTGIIPNGW